MKFDETEELKEDDVLLDSDKEEGEAPVTEEELERTFVEHFPKGCPICQGEIRGNKFYNYFCKTCNLMFKRKDILEKEFGKYGDETPAKHKLTKKNQNKLMDKKTALNEKIKTLFSDNESPPSLPKTESETKSKAESTNTKKVELPPLEIEKQIETPTKKTIEQKTESVEAEIIKPDKLTKLADIANITTLTSPTPKPVITKDDEETEPVEYETEDPNKIIASKESTKIHMGNCHFIKKIHPENRIYFDSIEKGLENEYQPCVCVRRVIAKQRAEKQ